jgi:hypothetical protein
MPRTYGAAMRNLLQDADRDRLVAPLAGPLAAEVAVGGRRHHALAAAPGAAAFPAEANARAAELLLLPGLRDAHEALSDALLDFVMAMADAPVPCRHAVAGRAEIRRADPRAFEVATPFFRLSGDLAAGMLCQRPAGSDEPALYHTGNLVEFRIGRHGACADVEDAVTTHTVERQGERVVVEHVSRITGRAGLLLPRVVEAGTLAVRYVATGDSPLLRVTVRFTAARALRRLRVTTALDAVDQPALGATAARLLEAGAWRDALPPAAPGPLEWARGVPVAHLAIGREGWPAGAPVLHIRPHAPDGVAAVTASALAAGALHWLLLRHGPADLAAGETLTVREDRLLAPSGAVRPVAAAMEAALADGRMAGLDLDPAPDGGAALMAVGTALMWDAMQAWRTPLPEPRRVALWEFAAREAARIEAASRDGATASAAGLAAAAIGADGLRRAGQGSAAALQGRLAERLAALVEPRGGVLRGPDGPAGLAAQSLAILAFARAAAWPDGARAAAALSAVLAPLVPAGGPLPAEAPALHFAGRPVDPLAEAEGLALLGRAAGAAALASEAGVALHPAAAARARDLHRIAVNLLRPLVRLRGAALEVVATGPGPAPAGPTPGLQALATLAFLAPDRLVLGPAEHPSHSGPAHSSPTQSSPA